MGLSRAVEVLALAGQVAAAVTMLDDLEREALHDYLDRREEHEPLDSYDPLAERLPPRRVPLDRESQLPEGADPDPVT